MGLTRDQLRAALAFSDDGGGEAFELVPAVGKAKAIVVEVKPATSADYLRFVVRRVKGEKERFLADVRRGLEQAKAAGEASSDGDADADARDEAIVQQMLLVADRQLDSGPESKAALAAICIGYPGDEEVEEDLMRSPRLLALHAVADRLTNDRPDFSSGVSEHIWGTPTPTSETP
ncbi:hypothetical protein ACUXK4_004534 [Methylorubrum extorquens]